MSSRNYLSYDPATTVVGLIRNRHPMPVNNYIFDKIKGGEDIFNFEEMQIRCEEFVKWSCSVRQVDGKGINQIDQSKVKVFKGNPLVCYVTGLTQATAALISVCAKYGVPLTLMHHNIDTGDYVPQKII